MNAIKQIARLACAAAVAGIATWTVAQAQGAPPGNAGIGKRLFIADGCYTCHGRSGQGGAYNGPAPILAKTALPFDGFKGADTQPGQRYAGFPREAFVG
ncbi:MAG: c-type cytochrome [Xanthobacteraceae bacterium]